ncbi:MAG: chromosomal replication initiator DnaA [Hyphomicrobiaceae bacterium]|nr:chromosomal replication initiator DnaA [Hyphomicrobiaceae bacterium]
MHLSTSSRWPWPRQRLRRPPEAREADASLRILLEQTVARVFDVELDLMRLPTRGRARVAMARQVAMYLAHVACGLSLTEAGDLFERDRTTVAHACQVVEDRREDSEFDRALDLLENVTKVLTYPPMR